MESSDFAQLAREHTRQSIAVKQAVLQDQELMAALGQVALECRRSLAAAGKLLLFGNGGSAADAQHIAAELVGRFKRERRALPAIALTVNTSILTAIANDYGFGEVFARQVEALGARGDVAVAISTSGNSPNVLRGVEAAKEKGIVTVGLTGSSGGNLKAEAHYCLRAPSEDTPRVQEVHILIGHILSEYLERELCESAG